MLKEKVQIVKMLLLFYNFENMYMAKLTTFFTWIRKCLQLLAGKVLWSWLLMMQDMVHWNTWMRKNKPSMSTKHRELKKKRYRTHLVLGLLCLIICILYSLGLSNVEVQYQMLLYSEFKYLKCFRKNKGCELNKQKKI